jgi:ATP-binding cassette subfamily C exporter for protease/lipase/ATP-binding cassette subfamily C protein EexD
MKRLWDELRPLLATLAGLSFFINLLYLVPAVYMMQVFDRVLPSNSQETLLVLLLGTGGALLVMLAIDYVRTRLQHLVGTLIDERLSPPVVKTVVAAAAARSGPLQGSDGVRDVAALRAAFSANGLIALFDAPWVFFYVAVIWAFHPALGVGAIGAALVMLALAWLNDRLSRRALEGLQQESRRASQYVESSLRNAEILQALGMTQGLLGRWRALHARINVEQTKASSVAVSFTAGTRFVRQSVQVLMLSLGAYLVLTQQASAGIMIATTILLGRAVQPVEQLVGSWRMLVDARSAYARLRELARHFEREEPKLELPRPQGRLAAEAVSYRLSGSDRAILSGVAFSLAAGEALAIIGPSGAGKSTLARIITGIWAANAGSVRLDGADVATWPREHLGPCLGYVPQDVELFEGSVADNIARLGKVDSEQVVAAATRANAHDMILGLAQGYDTPVGAHGVLLSPGQRQRVALARAMYGDPRLLVLDEPNSNLDGEGEAALAQALAAARKQGVTAVVITHRPSLIAHVDKILVLAAGRVQQYGPATQVMKAMQQQAQAMVADKAA